VTCYTRSLASGVRVEVLEHRVVVEDQSVLAFLDRFPALDGRISLQDLLFLESLAETRYRDMLLREPGGPDVPDGLGAPEGSDVPDGPGALEGPDVPDGPGAPEGSDVPDAVGLPPVERVRLALITTALATPAFRSAVADSLRANVRDQASEHGGVLVLSNDAAGPLRLLEVPSEETGDEHSYTLPVELFTAGSVAVWHNHASNPTGLPFEELDDSAISTPSGSAHGSLETVGGDMWIAYMRDIAGLVFAPTGQNTFSAVYYDEQEDVVDLGRFPAS
jgi:hypothetical protein